MRRLPVLALAVSLLLFCQQAAAAGLTKISDSVYSYVDCQGACAKNSFGSNAGIIIGKDFLVAVDALMSAKEAQRFIKDIRKISNKPIKFLIDTHYHSDHTLGNVEFAKLGAIIISQENARKNMEKAGAGMVQHAEKSGLSPQDLKDTKVTHPTLTFKERVTLYLGNNKVEIIYPGPAHTSGNVIVYVPREKVLFAGDLLFTDFHPYLGEADIAGWVKVLDRLMAMDVTKIIPGHGPLSTKKDLADLKTYLLVFDQKAKELSAKSHDLDFITVRMKKSLPKRGQLDSLIPRNIQMKYLAKEKLPQPQGK